MPTLLCLTSLTWDAISSWEAEQAWVLLLDWGRVHIAWHSTLQCTVFKSLLHAVFWLRPEFQVGSKAGGPGGNKHLASMSLGARVPNSSLLPESAAS